MGEEIRSATADNKDHRGEMPWSVVLNGVPAEATKSKLRKGMQRSLHSKEDNQPPVIKLGHANYQASDIQVSQEVRSLSERHGRLTNFYLIPEPNSQPVWAAAEFQDEEDA